MILFCEEHQNHNHIGIKYQTRRKKPSDQQHKPGKLGCDCTTPYFARLTLRLRGMQFNLAGGLLAIGCGSPRKGLLSPGILGIFVSIWGSKQVVINHVLMTSVRYLETNPDLHCFPSHSEASTHVIWQCVKTTH